jgi:protein involved in polysaccharide export with SLBB domain
MLWQISTKETMGQQEIRGHRTLAASAVFIFMIWCGALCAQSPQTQGARDPNAGTPFGNTPDSESAPASGAIDRNTRSTLSASQIIALVNAKPELAIELKKLVADQLQAQGEQIQEDSITDEMLFSRIASDANLRSVITNWLRARGYISGVDVGRAGGSSNEQDDNSFAGLSGDQAYSGVGRTAMTSDPLARRITSEDQDAFNDRLMLDSDGKLVPDVNERLSAGSRASQTPMSAATRRGAVVSSRPKQTPAVEAEVLHQSTPYNLLSLRDLYTQVPEQSARLKRFGSDVFLNGGTPSKEMPIDLPVGPDYVLGVGDGLNISLWGGISQSFTRVVDREGRIILPEAGTIVVAGETLEQAEALIKNALTQQFRDARVSVSVAHLRTVRVYVVGDVQRPGAYDISSLSTPLNALYAAGGPTSVGSLRTVRHYRGKNLICDVDLYQFLLHGVFEGVERLEPGDTILVPPAGAQVTVAGMVKRPAIYELKEETKLSEVLGDAGGVTVSAALSQIRVERVAANDHRETVSMTLPVGSGVDAARRALESFSVKDGDRIMVAPILPYSERAIYLEGHVVRPGKYPYRDNLTLSDVIRSYQDLLPEPAEHGEIVRLMPPDLRPETIEFNVPEVMIGSAPILLHPFDTVRILGRYEVDAPKATIRGEVLRPGSYALSQGMTAAKLVRMAGGFNRSALLGDADLASYAIQDGKQVVSSRSIVKIGAAVNNNDANADVPLKPGDVLTVHQVSGWNDIGASVELDGEVTYPGTYGLQEGEKLSSVIRRAGGFRSTAYPQGAVLVRAQVRELEEKSRAELIHQIETTPVGAKLASSAAGQDQAGTLQLLVQQQDQVLQRLRSQPVTGRLVIKISVDVSSWENTPADIEMRRGDVLTIPKRPGFVLVSGQVYNASALTYVPDKSAEWYLQHAGGTTDVANRKEIFVVRANGSVIGRRSGGWHSPDVLSTHLDPGDAVVVPQKIMGASMFWRNMLTTAQIASSIAITVALSGL